MHNQTKSIAVACVMGVLALGSSSSFAYTTGCPDGGAYPLNGCALPGTAEGSFPYFDNVVAVTSKAKIDKNTEEVQSFAIKAKQYGGSVDNHLVVDSDTNYLIEKPKFNLKVNFLSETEVEGKLKISGKIDSDGDGKGEKFTVTADLEGPVDSSEDGTLWGFDTMNIVCSDLINTLTGGCTTNEVVYLNLLEAIGPEFGTNISTAGRALTSVPVPAAAWLFGSGLLGLIAVSRRAVHKAEG
jgi:hypothetical protein